MPYLGNELATQFQAFATQTITGDGSTGYTLDRAVANGKELLVYINNVKQEEGSGKAYTASGTTITFSEAVASGDSCYVVFLGSAIQTVTAPAGSIVSSQFSSADLVLPKTVTIGSAAEEDTKLVFDGNAQDYHVGLDDSADALTIGVGSTLGTNTAMTIDSSGRVLQPNVIAWSVVKTSTQTASGDDELITWDTVRLNQGSGFNTTGGNANKFVAPIHGIYTCYATFLSDTDSTTHDVKLMQGSTVLNRSRNASVDGYESFGIAWVGELNASDVIHLEIKTSGRRVYGDTQQWTTWSGHFIG